ncbi:MAG TPA: DUF305 domain-containing protein [Steroidobacteraceae bacterium]|nr:DUF305 domain-containing protein [Steroidobacteraceae bacterium]
MNTRSKLLTAALACLAAGAFTSLAHAEEPGRGLTARFEIAYLKMIADHHLSALRMTELAAGTDLARDPAISPEEGTSPSPHFAAVQAKAQSPELKSLARRNNRMQREEILTALGFLHDWYGIQYQPRIDRRAQAQIALLERTQSGERFDHVFMEVLSRHHYLALVPSVKCQVSVELEHHMLQRYCSGIVHGQINDISDMREMLCRDFSICDYQPLVGLKGRHTGSEGHTLLDADSNVELSLTSE